jgi:hypothetical protein
VASLRNQIPAPKYVALAILAAVGLGILIERLIVTDAERIRSILDEIRDCALEGRWDDAVDYLDPEGDFDGMDREEIRRLLHQTFKGRPLKQFRVLGREVEVRGENRARVGMTVLVRGSDEAGLEDRAMGTFEIDFGKREDLGWVILRVRMIQ